MKWTDCREIARWTVVTAVAVMCLGGVRMATCALDTAAPMALPKVTVAGCELTASVEQVEGTDNLRVTIQANNTTAQEQSLDADVTLVRREFTGNPMSRTMSPNDYKETLESVVHIDERVPASGTNEFQVVLAMDGAVTEVSALPDTETTPQGTVSALKMDSATYQVNVEQGGGKQPLASFAPKRPGQ